MEEEILNVNDLNENIESDIEQDEFFFESDHLALRGNSDYTCVLRTIAILQAQRIQVTKDIDKLATAERIALDDPDEFLKKLQKGELNFPGAISVAELPKINFEKYGVSIPEFIEEEQKTETTDVTVRGRVFDQTKPETFNQLWTYEEQKRLEELLIEYPPEPVEMRRFAKIAKALGNRTTKQVASRLQKYFKKLHSAGMPVPGRIPRSSRTYISKSSRIMKQALRPTTFFPANHVPVLITEDDGDDGGGGVPLSLNWYRKGCMLGQQNGESGGSSGVDSARKNKATTANDDRQFIVDDDDDNNDDESEGGAGGGGEDGTKANKYPVTDEGKILRILFRIKRDKDKDGKMERVHCEHDGFKCDFCEEEPIIGTRWHCTMCTDTSIDFCSDCLLTQLKLPDKRHSLEHKFIGFRVSSVNQICSNGTESRLQSDDSDSRDDDEDEEDDDGDDGDNDDDDDDDEDDIERSGSRNITGASGNNPIGYDDETNRGTSSSCSSNGKMSTSVAGTSSSYFDEDYLTNKFTVKQEYNYLDPNFMPH